MQFPGAVWNAHLHTTYGVIGRVEYFNGFLLRAAATITSGNT
jgi:hypothetical protein